MSAERLREAAKVLRERVGACDPWEGDDDHGSWADEYRTDGGNGTDAAFIRVMHPGVGLALADWLDDAAEGDGRLPHRYPTPSPDGDVIAWACRACGEMVSEYGTGARTECPVDWRGRDPLAIAVADAILGGAS